MIRIPLLCGYSDGQVSGVERDEIETLEGRQINDKQDHTVTIYNYYITAPWARIIIIIKKMRKIIDLSALEVLLNVLFRHKSLFCKQVAYTSLIGDTRKLDGWILYFYISLSLKCILMKWPSVTGQTSNLYNRGILLKSIEKQSQWNQHALKIAEHVNSCYRWDLKTRWLDSTFIVTFKKTGFHSRGLFLWEARATGTGLAVTSTILIFFQFGVNNSCVHWPV